MDFEIVGLLEIGSRSFYIQLYVESRKFPRFRNAHDLQNNTCTRAYRDRVQLHASISYYSLHVHVAMARDPRSAGVAGAQVARGHLRAL